MPHGKSPYSRPQQGSPEAEPGNTRQGPVRRTLQEQLELQRQHESRHQRHGQGSSESRHPRHGQGSSKSWQPRHGQGSRESWYPPTQVGVKSSEATICHRETATFVTRPDVVCLSTYMLENSGLKTTVLNLLSTILKPEEVVLLPHYEAKGDTQCSVTGKMKKDESPKNAAIREVVEELGFHVVDPEKIVFIGSQTIEVRNHDGTLRNVTTWHYFVLRDISSTCEVSTSDPAVTLRTACQQRAGWVDDFNQRVCVFVTCAPNDASVETIKARERLPTAVTGDCAGVVMMGMPTKDLIKMIREQFG